MNHLIHDSIFNSAARTPNAEALVYGEVRCTYGALALQVRAAAALFLAHGLGPGERVAVYMEKRIENVVAMFGAAAAGCVFVPVNPLLKPNQVAYILADCNVRLLVTTPERQALLAPVLVSCPDLRMLLLTGATPSGTSAGQPPALPATVGWPQLDALAGTPVQGHRRIDTDMAAILYTSGSTGEPKGVVLSHRNMVAGAASVAGYLGLEASDRLLAVLPMSFDYGLSQLTTAFLRGAAVVLMNYLFPKDIVAAVRAERITGLAAVPPLWIALARLAWPADCTLRFITNSGGAMPVVTVEALQQALPRAEIFLMYGLTEAFRSTYLPPSELERRPDSMGRAIPNAQVMVVRPDGTPCEPHEAGELVHRGALVSLGYWNDPVKTAERFKPAPGQDPALPLVEMAVWSGDTVRMDEDGYLYFIGRSDDMIKVSGYRVSPNEVEEAVYATGLVAETVAFGVPHPQLGQAIVLLALPKEDVGDKVLLKECQRRLPAWMVPAHIAFVMEAFPRNPNGKIDRKTLRMNYLTMFEDTP